MKPGKQYAVYVGVDNRSDHKARISVDADGTTHPNYTTKSIAKIMLKLTLIIQLKNQQLKVTIVTSKICMCTLKHLKMVKQF